MGHAIQVYVFIMSKSKTKLVHRVIYLLFIEITWFVQIIENLVHTIMHVFQNAHKVKHMSYKHIK